MVVPSESTGARLSSSKRRRFETLRHSFSRVWRVRRGCVRDPGASRPDRLESRVLDRLPGVLEPAEDHPGPVEETLAFRDEEPGEGFPRGFGRDAVSGVTIVPLKRRTTERLDPTQEFFCVSGAAPIVLT